MAGRDHDSTWDEINELEKNLFPDESNQSTAGRNTQGPLVEKDSPATPSPSATPDLLNTAFINDTVASEQSQGSLTSSQQYRQSANDTTTTVQYSLNPVVESDHETIDLCTPTMPTAPAAAATAGPTTTRAVQEVIDLCTPQTIDLTTPGDTSTNTDDTSAYSPLQLTPK